jgi:hypothetical protein
MEYTKQISSLYLQNSRRDQQKNNFDCQIYKKWEALKWEEIHSRLIYLQIRMFQYYILTDELAFQLCTRPEKFARLPLKIRVRTGREKLVLIARF